MTSTHSHRFVEVNGVGLHIAEQGQGPLVLLLHGWPESWYSWRHQFGPLVAAGYRVVAPDQRGYARSEQPPHVASYTLLHLVGDVIALIEELGEEQAVVVGHDWGAPVAWTAAMLRPDKVRAVAGLSIPPILPGGMVPPSITRTQYGEGFYQIYFQQPGVADAELARDIPASFRRILSRCLRRQPARQGTPSVGHTRRSGPLGHHAGVARSPRLADGGGHPGVRRGLCPARASGPSPEPSTGTGTSNATTNCSRLSGGGGSTFLRCTWWETAT